MHYSLFHVSPPIAGRKWFIIIKKAKRALRLTVDRIIIQSVNKSIF